MSFPQSVTVHCVCGERYGLYMAPGAAHWCWKCRRLSRIVGNDWDSRLMQEVTGGGGKQYPPSYRGWVTL